MASPNKYVDVERTAKLTEPIHQEITVIFECWVLQRIILVASKRWHETLSGTTTVHGICAIRTCQEVITLQQEEITVPVQIDEVAEWCNSLLLEPKPSMTVQLCLILHYATGYLMGQSIGILLSAIYCPRSLMHYTLH